MRLCHYIANISRLEHDIDVANHDHSGTQYDTIRYDTIICNAHGVCQLAESEARAVTGGTWQG